VQQKQEGESQAGRRQGSHESAHDVEGSRGVAIFLPQNSHGCRLISFDSQGMGLGTGSKNFWFISEFHEPHGTWKSHYILVGIARSFGDLLRHGSR
jgi:hypothetical protein